jgi:hypothetical protein
MQSRLTAFADVASWIWEFDDIPSPELITNAAMARSHVFNLDRLGDTIVKLQAELAKAAGPKDSKLLAALDERSKKLPALRMEMSERGTFLESQASVGAVKAPEADDITTQVQENSRTNVPVLFLPATKSNLFAISKIPHLFAALGVVHIIGYIGLLLSLALPIRGSLDSALLYFALALVFHLCIVRMFYFSAEQVTFKGRDLIQSRWNGSACDVKVYEIDEQYAPTLESLRQGVGRKGWQRFIDVGIPISVKGGKEIHILPAIDMMKRVETIVLIQDYYNHLRSRSDS